MRSRREVEAFQWREWEGGDERRVKDVGVQTSPVDV